MNVVQLGMAPEKAGSLTRGGERDDRAAGSHRQKSGLVERRSMIGLSDSDENKPCTEHISIEDGLNRSVPRRHFS